MKLWHKYSLLMLSAGACFACVTFAAVFFFMRLEARNLAEISLLSVADHKIAASIYYETVSRPKLLEALKSAKAEGHFDPSILSGTFIERSKQEIYDFVSSGNYRIRTFAVNARTTAHEASELEQQFLSELNHDRELLHKSYERDIAGKPHMILLHRDSVQEQSCLGCHGDPADAPDNLVKTYGTEKGFNRKVGDIVSGFSVTVPLQAFYAEAHIQALKLSTLLLAALIGLLLFSYWVAKRFMPNQENGKSQESTPE